MHQRQPESSARLGLVDVESDGPHSRRERGSCGGENRSPLARPSQIRRLALDHLMNGC